MNKAVSPYTVMALLLWSEPEAYVMFAEPNQTTLDRRTPLGSVVELKVNILTCRSPLSLVLMQPPPALVGLSYSAGK